ncbi:MAG TPA: ATP-dependent DNA helicase [Actinomycetota bacterium]|nr:ATP-dependent DNA helicase [Actinomycetota bacterium]
MSAAKIPDPIVRAMGAEPTDEQWRAISMPLEPYVLVAGAGSGKTSVMAARVVYLALVALGAVDGDGTGVLPGNVLCLTFTNKATENLQHRIRHALAGLDLPEGEEPEVQNYHGFAASLLDRHGLLAGIEPGARILSAAQRNELCARVLDEMTFDRVSATYQPSLISKILELDDQAMNHLVTPDGIVAFNEMRMEQLKNHRSDRAFRSALERVELARAGARYRELKRELGVMDYGDQIELALRVVQNHPEVAAGYRERFGAVLLDEYQDTNVAQATLMVSVFGGGHPVTAVGDPDQNIYAWRGASLFNLLEFPQQFRRADGSPATKLPLYTNFRSGSHILEAADTVIAPLPAAQRPDPEKRLVPHPPNGEGEVRVTRHLDEWSEASSIAVRVVKLHEAGTSWSEAAVLCRTSRLFQLLQRAFAEREVPVEVLGLAGLLKLPEVVEVLAYARAVLDPRASVALARILLGPRYRVGFKDVALLAALATKESKRFREELDLDEDDRFLFAEALERLDDVDGLSDEGRARLTEFRDELRELRGEARRPVAEFLAEVIRRTGLLAELEADLDRTLAQASKRNLAAFLEEVHRFEPVEGELTLRAFLDYVDEVERLDKQEWAPVQPSDDDSVKVMTIHVAKGLEFEHVFVPGFAHGLLPNPEIPQNPAERGKSLDFELRGDAAILPRYDGVLKHFKDTLRAQEIVEERRTAYVALTRARKTLSISGAHWYGDNLYPKGASMFLEELAEWGEHTQHAAVDRGPADPGEDNPMLGLRERFVRDWPGPALRTGEADELFPGGWRAAAAGGAQPSLVEALPSAERREFEALASARRLLAAHLRDRETAEDGPHELLAPSMISASGIVDYGRCPKRFYWSYVRPLPRFSGVRAMIGTDIHGWIERRASGQGTLLELDEPPDLTLEELAGDPGTIERLREAYLKSRFADIVPLWAERPFLLRLEGFTVGGRIDAIFGEPDGPWEVVDWKTGRMPADPLQLDVYGLACIDIWHKRPEDVTLTYLYLASGEEVSHPMGDPEDVRAGIAASLTSIASGDYEPAPGPACAHCDFRSFCDAGKEWLAVNA